MSVLEQILYATESDPCLPPAVITGPTSGIGEQFAHQLAKAGFNVFLVSRSQAGLDKVASEIRALVVRRLAPAPRLTTSAAEAKVKGVQTRTLAIDLSQQGEDREKGFRKLDEQLGGLEVGVLGEYWGARPGSVRERTLTNTGQSTMPGCRSIRRRLLPKPPSPRWTRSFRW